MSRKMPKFEVVKVLCCNKEIMKKKKQLTMKRKEKENFTENSRNHHLDRGRRIAAVVPYSY